MICPCHACTKASMSSTLLSEVETYRARWVMMRLPGMAMSVNPNAQATTVAGLTDALQACGAELQRLHDLLAKREDAVADLENVRRILRGDTSNS